MHAFRLRRKQRGPRSSAQCDLAFVGTALEPVGAGFALTGVRQIVAVAAEKILAAADRAWSRDGGTAARSSPPGRRNTCACRRTCTATGRAARLLPPPSSPRRCGTPGSSGSAGPPSAQTDAGHLLAVSPPLQTGPGSRLKASFLVEPVDVERAAALHLSLPARPSRPIAAQFVLSRV